MIAFTAGDLVLINPVRITGRDDVARRMLFHEVVHGHEYGALGLEHFLHEYLSGVIASRDYRDLPLERVAYAAYDRCMLNPQVVFSVDEMVRKRALGCVPPPVWLDEQGRPRTKRPCPRCG